MTAVLTIDFETRSTVDLRKTGVYVYAESPDTDVHCAAWAIDDGPISVWRRGEPVPEALADHVEFGGTCAAWNANFEIAIWTHILAPRHGWPLPKLKQWRCSMASAYAQALPGALENAAGAVGLDITKDASGKRLMLAMAKPRRPKKGESSDALLWREAPEELEALYRYCATDVEVERGIRARLVNLRPQEVDLWHLDQEINSRGVPVDAAFAQRSAAVVDAYAAELDKQMVRVTDHAVTACTNVTQLKLFMRQHGVEPGQKLDKNTFKYVDSLAKEFVAEILRDDIPANVRAALELRQQGSLASVSKIDALLRGTSADGRARGLMQFSAASTGRWAGRRFQPQNIKRVEDAFDVDGAISVIENNSAARATAILDSMYGPPLTCISYTLRGMVRAEKGKKIVAADFTSIEGVVLPWLAGEQFKLDAFRQYIAGKGPDMYLVAASGIYGIPVEKMSKKTHPEERQIGKVAELACGYGGGVGAFQTMASGYGVAVTDEKAESIKSAWRAAHPNVVQFWWDLEAAAIDAVNAPGQVVAVRGCKFKVVGSFLWCQLPSGRSLCYPYPKTMWLPTPWGQEKEMLTFRTTPNISNAKKIVHSDKSNTGKWARISTYGGMLAENVTQAVARDLLAEAMMRLDANGYPIILHVHDEAVAEVPENFGSVKEFEQIMAELPPWAKGLPVAASGFEGPRYRKG